MRKLKIIEHISLDGVIQAPGGPDEDSGYAFGGWAAPFQDDAGGEAIVAAQGDTFDLLLGRRTYDIFAGFWPDKNGPMADNLNAATKYVATHNPDSLKATVTAATLRPIMLAHIDDKSALYTDDAGQYRKMNDDFAHQVVNHSAEEYVRGAVHTNTIEGYFSILKRGIIGTYHHVSQQHLGRYLAEFDFRYNNRVALGVADQARTDRAMRGIVGKWLMYRDSSAAIA